MKKSILKALSLILTLAILCTCGSLISFAGGDEPAEDKGNTPFRVTVSARKDGCTKGFCWYTAGESETKVVLYDVTGADVTSSVTLSDVTCSEWEGNYMHKVTASGLEKGKTYCYKVGGGNDWSDMGTFVTDDGDSSFSFITIADVQASSLENFRKGADTLAAAFETMPEAEFVANCGDFTNDSTNEEWDNYDKAFSSINAATTLVPVAGNHDGLGVWHWFENTFNLDTSESVQCLNGVNYSFDYGNAHFAVLNTNDVLSISLSQLRWLRNDMNSTSKDWKIVFMHKSPYTLGKDGKWPDALYLQRSLTAVLDACDVDMVFSGHDHMYLRTKPLTGNRLDENGVTYVLSGTAGTKRYEVRTFLANIFMKTKFIDMLNIQKGGYGNYWNGTDWSSTRDSNVGGCFNCISINGGELTLKSYILGDESGEVTNTDTCVIKKETGKNKATFSGDNTTDEAVFYMGVVPSFMGLAAYTFGEWLPKFLIMIPGMIAAYVEDGTF